MLCETVEEVVHRPLYEIIQRDAKGRLESYDAYCIRVGQIERQLNREREAKEKALKDLKRREQARERYHVRKANETPEERAARNAKRKARREKRKAAKAELAKQQAAFKARELANAKARARRRLNGVRLK